MRVVEALRTIGRPGGIDAIHLADHAVCREPGDQRQVVGHPFVLQRYNARDFRGLARGEAYSLLGAAALEQPEKWAATPILGRLTLARRSVFDQLGTTLVALAAPARDTAFMHRMQSVDDDRSTRERQPGFEGPPAETVEQSGLALPCEPGFSQPRAKLGKICEIHLRLSGCSEMDGTEESYR